MPLRWATRGWNDPPPGLAPGSPRYQRGASLPTPRRTCGDGGPGGSFARSQPGKGRLLWILSYGAVESRKWTPAPDSHRVPMGCNHLARLLALRAIGWSGEPDSHRAPRVSQTRMLLVTPSPEKWIPRAGSHRHGLPYEGSAFLGSATGESGPDWRPRPGFRRGPRPSEGRALIR